MDTIYWQSGAPVILDQTLLPERELYLRIESVEAMAEAIRALRVRGAPLLGVAAAFGLALAARLNADEPDFMGAMRRDAAALAATRPTAVNLFFAIDLSMRQIEQAFQSGGANLAARRALECAQHMKGEDARVNRALGRMGAPLIRPGDGVLTHCNAGALATAGYGTALGVLRAAAEQGAKFRVYADETRPLLQGARLTAWELARDGMDVTVLCDGMAGALMAQGKIQLAVVGADRIARNGDTANKIGTYSVAALCAAHNIPFYVAAPLSTIDAGIASGAQIPIEYRDAREITHFMGRRVAPEGVAAFNPAFDVTPARLIAGIVTEAGVLRAPFEDSIARALNRA